MPRISFDEPAAPASYDELFEKHWRLIESRVRKSGVPAQDLDDVASTLAEKMLSKDILKIYDPKKSRFPSFLSVFCDRYLLWEREKIQTRWRRETSSDVDVMVELVPSEEIEDTVIAERDYSLTVEKMRAAVVEYQAKQIAIREAKNRHYPRNLVALFDLIIEHVNDSEPFSVRKLGKLLGVTDSTVSAMKRDIQEALQAQGLTPAVLTRT